MHIEIASHVRPRQVDLGGTRPGKNEIAPHNDLASIKTWYVAVAELKA
jgi:hypothetical protein